MDYKGYPGGKEVSEIRTGQSGASVYEIDGKTVLKHVVRRDLPDDRFDTYSREALFYREKSRENPPYLPEVLDAQVSGDEITVVLKKYHRIDRAKIDDSLIRKVAVLLARIHTDRIPAFMRGDSRKADLLPTEQIQHCLEGWQAVLAEHPGVFDEAPLLDISRKLNGIIEWHDGEERLLSHGDFHWDNLLADDAGNLLVCDWQGVCVGGESGDISFFMSRSGADGIAIDEQLFLDAYSGAVRNLTGRRVNAEEIRRHMAAANIITTFVFWHMYLHGNDAERVKGIYGKMAEDFRMFA